MKIIVDADSCPVKDIVENTAREYEMEVLMVASISHNIKSSYAEVLVVDNYQQAADISIMNVCEQGDLVVTQDYGLASMILSKGGFALAPDGRQYNEENIESLLMSRYVNEKIRKAGGRTRGPAKRNKGDDKRFQQNLCSILEKCRKLPKPLKY